MEPGQTFAGDFRILRPLGRGGMGSVYLALQLSTGRKRALKVLLPHQNDDPRIREQFIAEARIAAGLDSDHVADVVAAGIDTESGSPWLATEYLEGETLEARVTRAGRLAPLEVQEILRQICHALGQAHSAGLVHRDIKPANLFVADPRRDGVPFTVKVLDFGIATLTERRTQGSLSQPIGSPRWMAPEQSEPHRATPATDVWALGLVAYFCLVGRTLWASASNQGAPGLAEILGSEIPRASERAREFGVTLPAGFDAWFERCVVRDPARRFPDAWHALSAIPGWQVEGLGAAPPVTAPAPSGRITAPAPPQIAGNTRVTAPLMPADTSGAPHTGGGTYAPVLAERGANRSSAPVGRAVAGVMLLGSLVALGLLALAAFVGLYLYASPDLVSRTTDDPGRPSGAPTSTESVAAGASATPTPTGTASEHATSSKVAGAPPRRTATTTSAPGSSAVVPPEPTATESGLAPFNRTKATAIVNAAAAAAATKCKAQKKLDAGVETFAGEVSFRPDGTTSKFQSGLGGARQCVSQAMGAASYGRYQGPPGTDPSAHVETVKYTVTVQ